MVMSGPDRLDDHAMDRAALGRQFQLLDDPPSRDTLNEGVGHIGDAEEDQLNPRCGIHAWIGPEQEVRAGRVAQRHLTAVDEPALRADLDRRVLGAELLEVMLRLQAEDVRRASFDDHHPSTPGKKHLMIVTAGTPLPVLE
jgi:hypothetical protein